MPAGGFGNVTERALCERLANGLSVLGRRQHNHGQFRAGASEFGNGSQTVQSWHDDIQNDDIEVGMLRDQRERLSRIPGFEDVGVRSDLPKQGGETLAKHGMIINNEQLHVSTIGLDAALIKWAKDPRRS